MSSLQKRYSLRSDILTWKVRNLNTSKRREAIQERSENSSLRDLVLRREAIPGVGLEHKFEPRSIEAAMIEN